MRILNTNILFITIILLLIQIKGLGQTCTNRLEEAEKLFDQGLLEEIPPKIEACITKGFTKTERLSAYKLLILCYLYDDKLDEAEKRMLGFLKKYPEYRLSVTDPDMFKYLYNSYNTAPIFTIGLSGGILSSHYRPQNKNDSYDSGNKTDEYSPSGIGLGFGLKFGKKVYKPLDVELDILLNQVRSEVIKYPNNNTTYFDFSIYQINLPLSLTYNLDYGNWIPYARAGAGLGIIWSGSSASTKDYTILEDLKGTDESNFKYIIKPVNYFAVVGTGIKFTIPRGSIYLDIRYNIGLSDYFSGVTIGSNNGDEKDEKTIIGRLMNTYTYEFGQIPDQFKMNSLVLTAGWNYAVYFPTKKKR